MHILKRRNQAKIKIYALVFALTFLLFGGIKPVFARYSVSTESGPWTGVASALTTVTNTISTGTSSYILVGISADCTNSCVTNSVSTVTASGLTFTKLSGGATPAGHTTTEFWGAVSGGSVSSLVVTTTLAHPSNVGMMTLSLSNVDLVSPVGTISGPATMFNNLSVTFPSTTAGSMIFASAFSLPYDWNTVTAGPNTTVCANINVSQFIRSTSAVSGGSQTISSTGWTSGVAIEYSGIEILGAVTPPDWGGMSSSSYVISSDDLSAGGGRASSASFVSEGDMGGRAAGEGLTSASYAACAGFPCALSTLPPSITFSVSSNAVNLGALSSSAIASGSVTVTTTTNAISGYVTSVHTDGALRKATGQTISGVSDGTVTIGQNEYGIALSGADRAFANEQAISTTPITVASTAGSVSGSSTVVVFKAAISTTNAAGSYSQIATFVTTGTF